MWQIKQLVYILSLLEMTLVSYGVGFLIHYTATLPSSASVERLSNAASRVLTAGRCRLANETMDKLMFRRSMFKSENDNYYFLWRLKEFFLGV